MAIPFHDIGVQRSGLVSASVPENFQMLLRAVSFGIKPRVHPVYHFLIRATLEGCHLHLVVESKVEIQRHLNTASAGIQSSGYDGRSIECWRLTIYICKLSLCSAHLKKG